MDLLIITMYFSYYHLIMAAWVPLVKKTAENSTRKFTGCDALRDLGSSCRAYGGS